MSANGVIPFDPSLVTQSVNYHGHNLLKQLVSENASQIHTIKLQDIDYKVYQNRSTELRNLGGSRIQEIIGFIASKSDQLLVTQSKLPKLEENEESLDYEDRYKHQYPFEYFLNVNKNTRIQEFMNVVEVGDILFAEVVNSFENTSYTSLKFIAYDGGKHRYLTDIKATDLKLVLKNEDTFVSKADEDKIGRWMCGTRLRIEVLNINVTTTIPCLFVGTKGATLESTKREHIKLGKVQIKDLPQILSVTLDPSVRYLSDCIEKMNSFKNPQCIRKMASRSNIDLHWYPSLLNSVTNDIPLTETAKSLRKSQMCKWAHKNVADGVTYFKKGQHEEAFQCLSKALQIDPDNVEAFVAKGALLANLGRYEKAIEDFEKSLSSNPDHVNARKYMCETLVELGKQKEEKDELKEAEKCYSRCLELNEHHAVAREALNDVSRKLGPESSLMKLIKQETMKNDTEYIADLIQIEQELNKKRNFEENPIPTITSKGEELRPMTEVIQVEDDEDDENDDNSQMKMEGALSPLSQKLANQESLWTRPPSVSAISIAPIQSYPTSKMNMNFFSNPPPNWPVHALVSRPPPILTQPPKLPVAPNYDDQNYKARVEEFLKELETKSLGERTRKKSDSAGKDVRKITKRKDEKKEKKKRNRSSSSSGSGSSSDDSSKKKKKKKRRSSSSSSSASSSSSSTSSDSSGSEKGKRKVSKKSKKLKSKKKKKTLKKIKKEKEVEVEAAVPDFLDLEEKLMAYYKKMEAMQTSQDRSKSKSSSRGNSLEKKNKLKKSETKHIKKKKGENMDVSSNPLVNKLKLITHPAFLDDESEEEAAPKGAKLPKNSAPSRTQQENKFVVKRKKTSITPSVNKRRSSPSSSSRSSERDSRSRGRRSSSRSRRRSRSYSRERRSRSRSRRNINRNSRSRSRSRSRSQYGAKYQDRSISKEKFGYWKDKPYFNSNKVPPIKNTQKKGDPTPIVHKPPPVQFEFKRRVDPKSIHVVEDAKKKIFQHLASNAKEFNTKMKPNEGRNEERFSTGSLAPSNRFGKWVNESNIKVDSSKTPVPEGSLAQFENFIKVAKEKNMELMKERNKAFLKPTER